MTYLVEVSPISTSFKSFDEYDFKVQGIDMLMEKVNDVIKSEKSSGEIEVTDEEGDYCFFNLVFNKISKLVWETFNFGYGNYIWKTKIHKL